MVRNTKQFIVLCKKFDVFVFVIVFICIQRIFLEYDMLKMKDLLEEGRKIQETFKKNVLTQSEAVVGKQAGGELSIAHQRKSSRENISDTNKILKKIPYKLRDKKFLYVGTILRPKSLIGDGRGLVEIFYTVVSDVLESYKYNEEKTLKYFDSLYMKPGQDGHIYSNLKGKEELEFRRLY